MVETDKYNKAIKKESFNHKQNLLEPHHCQSNGSKLFIKKQINSL